MTILVSNHTCNNSDRPDPNRPVADRPGIGYRGCFRRRFKPDTFRQFRVFRLHDEADNDSGGCFYVDKSCACVFL